MAEFNHYSVMLCESVDGMNVENGCYVDCTGGAGGHSLEIIKRIKDGMLVSIDQDKMAIDAIKARLADYSGKLVAVKDNFSNIDAILDSLEIGQINGAIIDLGVSNMQLSIPERGFMYMSDGPLDMRMNESAQLRAYDVVNFYSEDELKKILWNYGEEKFAVQIVSAIAKARSVKPIESTFELVEIIKGALPAKAKNGQHHPCKKSFQAIRIEVNKELDIIEPTLKALVKRLAKGGRLSVITFHSLEDRITKHTFAELAKGCTCPPSFPVCTCGGKASIKLVNKHPIVPSEKELLENPKSRSAKLRIIEKL